MTPDERARQDRAAKRANVLVLHKTQLGQRSTGTMGTRYPGENVKG